MIPVEKDLHIRGQVLLERLQSTRLYLKLVL